ncbi:hypothetical protein Tco_0757280 [Tanacetum coccineum]
MLSSNSEMRSTIEWQKCLDFLRNSKPAKLRKRNKKRENNRQIDKSVMEPGKSDEEEPPKGVDIKSKVERKADDEPDKSARKNVMKNEDE